MNKTKTLYIILFLALPMHAFSQLYINELMAKNKTGLKDNHWHLCDWVEIYNAGNTPVDIGGYCISDSIGFPCKCHIATNRPDSTTVKPHGYLVLYADGAQKAGATHLSFKISRKGETMGLYKKAGSEMELVDMVTFKSQVKDISYGRVPDGSGNWKFIQNPSPGSSNNKARTGKPPKQKSAKKSKSAKDKDDEGSQE